MNEKPSPLDQYRQNLSMAQQIANKQGYQELVQYIGEQKRSEKLAKLNAMIAIGAIEEDEDIQYYKARLIEEGKAYFVSTRATEITLLGLILGDTKRKYKGRKIS